MVTRTILNMSITREHNGGNHGFYKKGEHNDVFLLHPFMLWSVYLLVQNDPLRALQSK